MLTSTKRDEVIASFKHPFNRTEYQKDRVNQICRCLLSDDRAKSQGIDAVRGLVATDGMKPLMRSFVIRRLLVHLSEMPTEMGRECSNLLKELNTTPDFVRYPHTISREGKREARLSYKLLDVSELPLVNSKKRALWSPQLRRSCGVVPKDVVKAGLNLLEGEDIRPCCYPIPKSNYAVAVVPSPWAMYWDSPEFRTKSPLVRVSIGEVEASGKFIILHSQPLPEDCELILETVHGRRCVGRSTKYDIPLAPSKENRYIFTI